MAEPNKSSTMNGSGSLSPSQDLSFTHPMLRYRNLFCEMDHLRKELFTSENPDSELMGQVVNHLNQVSPIYMDTGIQSSPDSGVDMSSPDLKTGYLSSQDDFSPRIPDSFLPQDEGKPKPKYPDIGNIQMDLLYQSGTERCVNDQEPCCKWDVVATSSSDDKCEIPCVINELNNNHAEMNRVVEHGQFVENTVTATENSAANLLRTGKVDASSERRFSLNEAGHYSGHVTKECVNNSGTASGNETKINICGSPLKDDCTLAELNLSQTSASSDQLALLQKCQTMGDSLHENSFPKEDTSLDGNLFPSLEDDYQCSFAESGSPMKLTLTSSHVTPQHRLHSMFSRRSFTISPSPSKTSTPIKSKCSATESQSPGSNYLLEYQKFLQSCGTSETHTSSEVQPHRSRRKLAQSHKISDSFTKVLFSRHRSEDRDFRFREQFRKRTHSTTRFLIGQRHQPTPRNSFPTELTSDVRDPCPQRSLRPRPAKKPHKLNPKRFIKAEQKVNRLRRSAVKFLKAVFPNLDYPSPKRMLATVDVLLNQVLDCLLDRKPSHANRRLQAIPVNDDVKDVRIMICQSPLSCMRHLRHKICRVIKAVLPNLDLHWLSDQNTEQVDALLRYITQQNKVKKHPS